MHIDPITLEIMSNGFKSIADETYIALMKSAYSTNIKERHDHSTAIIDPKGRLIVQAENSLAIHLGSMMGLMNTLLAKVPLNARVPEERRGDYFAQIAACRLGVRRVSEMIEARGVPMLEAAFDEIIRRTGDRLREALRRVAPGEYTFEDVMDDDGVGTTNIPIKLRITVPPHDGNRKVLFDFTGSGPQVKGNINSTITATQAGVLYSLKALLDPDVPNNQGLIDIVDIHAPLGTIINAKFPAAVAARANTAQRIVDVVIGALAPAIPEAAVGAANGANTTAVFFGHDPRHDRDYVYLETLGGGFGGRFTKDGKDGVQVHITNTSNLPVESIEMEYPLRVESYGFVPDSGGAGKHRGGLGLRRVVRPIGHTMTFSGQGERFVNKPWGVFGGHSGGTGKFVKLSGGSEVPLPTKPANLLVTADEAIVVETPGAGGYGKPSERDKVAIENDLVSGKFSR